MLDTKELCKTRRVAEKFKGQKPSRIREKYQEYNNQKISVLYSQYSRHRIYWACLIHFYACAYCTNSYAHLEALFTEQKKKREKRTLWWRIQVELSTHKSICFLYESCVNESFFLLFLIWSVQRTPKKRKSKDVLFGMMLAYYVHFGSTSNALKGDLNHFWYCIVRCQAHSLVLVGHQILVISFSYFSLNKYLLLHKITENGFFFTNDFNFYSFVHRHWSNDDISYKNSTKRSKNNISTDQSDRVLT